MGEQVANNKEQQMVAYLKEVDGVWYILTEPKSNGLIKPEYLPVGNRLVFPKKWGRKKGALHLLQHMETQQRTILQQAEWWLDKINSLKIQIEEERN